MKIKKYHEFLLEKNIDEFKLCEIISALKRSYEGMPMFRTQETNFNVKSETRDWKDFSQEAKLEITSSIDCFYTISYELDDKFYTISISFVAHIKGQKEKDAPETASTVQLNRLSVILNNVNKIKIKINSSSFSCETSDLSSLVKKNVEEFLFKMLKSDYDIISSKIDSIEER